MEDISTARGLPMPSPLLMPRLTHGTDGDMDGQLTMEDMSTARGLPMPSPLLMPRLTHGTDGDMDGQLTMEDMSTARGLPMPSPLLTHVPTHANAVIFADAKAEPWWYGGYGYGAYYRYWPYYG